MTKKREALILGIMATIAIGYVVSKLSQKKSRTESLKAQAIVYLNEKNYEAALEILSTIDEENYEHSLRMFECHEKLGNLVNALIYLNSCIKDRRDKDLITKRFSIHKSLDMGREAFKDIFLLSAVFKDGGYKEMASSFLKKLCSAMAKDHKITGWASKINFTDFFDTLFFLKNEQDPATVFINSKEYEKCYEFVADSNKPLHRFLLGCFYFANGDPQTCFKILEPLDFQYCSIFIMFMKSKKLTTLEIEEIKRRISVEMDPTALFYMSKIFENLGEKSYQLECLESLLKLYPCACATNSKIIWLIKQNRHEDASVLIKDSLKIYPDDINLTCIALEYFLMRKNMEECFTILQMAEPIYQDDPRIYLFKFMIGETIDKPEPDFLRKAIEIDPKYFKPYVYLGNTLASGEESAVVFRKALECARSYDEIYTAYQLLIVVEAQNGMLKEHPDLFEN